MDLKNKVKDLCEYCGLPEEELAYRLNMSIEELYLYLSRDSISTKDLDKVAKAANCKFEGHFMFPDGKSV